MSGIKKGSDRVSENELLKRVELVAEFLIKGVTRTKGYRLVTNPEGEYGWDISMRHYDNYIKKAKALIKSQAKGKTEEFRSLAIARYNDLYQKNYSGMDFRECRNVQDSLNKLLGLNEPEKTDIKLTGSISPDKWLSENSDK